MTNLLILVGSDRNGFNATLAKAAADLVPESVTVEILWDLVRLPHYREELDAAGVDAAVDEFRAKVRASDGLLFVTPEYNGGPSSIIKNALDLASRPRKDPPIAGKPAAVIGATPSPGATGSSRAALREGFKRSGARVVGPTMGIARVFEYSEGYSPEIVSQIQEVVDALVREASAVDA